LPRGDQGEHLARQEQNGLAAPDARQDGVPHDLPARPAHCLALRDEGFAQGVQKNLAVSFQPSALSYAQARRVQARGRKAVSQGGTALQSRCGAGLLKADG
jgi:hypothetical protein